MIAKKIVTKVKEKALEDKFKSAVAIVNEVIKKEMPYSWIKFSNNE